MFLHYRLGVIDVGVNRDPFMGGLCQDPCTETAHGAMLGCTILLAEPKGRRERVATVDSCQDQAAVGQT